ncbi:MAG: hypothetical protein LBJ74_03485, partial [Heliobacteriaceae bacterium]|jgi:hypothetical protein|nr:hypothetical protein [Heliobacteriaceae bacterium]
LISGLKSTNQKSYGDNATYQSSITSLKFNPNDYDDYNWTGAFVQKAELGSVGTKVENYTVAENAVQKATLQAYLDNGNTPPTDMLLQFQYAINPDNTLRLKTVGEKIIDTAIIVERFTSNVTVTHYADDGTSSGSFDNSNVPDTDTRNNNRSIRVLIKSLNDDMMISLNVPVYAQESYMDDLMAYTQRYNEFTAYMNNAQAITNNYNEMLKKLSETPDKIVNEDDPKCQWYTNLWYRMGGISETAKEEPSNKFDVLDDNKINNADYLQYALETGTLAMEQVVFSEKGSGLYPGLKKTDWKACTYDNLSDISRQDNSLAVAKAEVKYKKAVEEIQVKDKRYDLDLKKLDTQHNALQTEYDSVKTIISKNTERSFKAFS